MGKNIETYIMYCQGVKKNKMLNFNNKVVTYKIFIFLIEKN